MSGRRDGGPALAAVTAAGVAVAGLAGSACVVTGRVPGMSLDQSRNADIVVSVTLRVADGSLLAARIAVMTAITESGMRDLGPMRGNDGSLGLFQQRPSMGWGTPAELMDPRYATAVFDQHLLAVPEWWRMPPWLAAQAVQRSAFADGSNYRAHWGQSGRVLAAVLRGGQAPGSCGQGQGSGAGLPAWYQILPGTPPAHATAVAFALAQLGKPYVWGAAGPGAYDCSGLTMAAWAAAGVHLLHYTGDQQHEGVPVTVSGLQPGTWCWSRARTRPPRGWPATWGSTSAPAWSSRPSTRRRGCASRPGGCLSPAGWTRCATPTRPTGEHAGGTWKQTPRRRGAGRQGRKMMSIAAVLGGVTVTPNGSGLPGLAEIEKIVGALLTFGLVISVAGLVIAAIVWAIGHHLTNAMAVNRARRAC